MDISIKEDMIEQYIGLRDISGKEICEGDIVKDVKYDTLYAIKWDADSCSFLFCSHSFVLTSSDFNAPIDLEIVGNIHDNPELIK